MCLWKNASWDEIDFNLILKIQNRSCLFCSTHTHTYRVKHWNEGSSEMKIMLLYLVRVDTSRNAMQINLSEDILFIRR